MQTLLEMLRKDLTCPTMKPKDQYPILELMKEFVTLKPKTYSYLSDDGYGEKKAAMDTKKCIIK